MSGKGGSGKDVKSLEVMNPKFKVMHVSCSDHLLLHRAGGDAEKPWLALSGRYEEVRAEGACREQGQG